MGVIHAPERERLLAHKTAIDDHLRECGFDVPYSAVLWSVRTDIKPSEIEPRAYEDWCKRFNIDPAEMAATDVTQSRKSHRGLSGP
jgi:hypothetical protein